jgi:hypothetical protein
MIDTKTLQLALKAQGYDPGPIDGISGPKTKRAVDAFLKSKGQVPWTKWGIQRRSIAAMQWVFRSLDIETGIVDGFWGPQTFYAFDVYKHMERTGNKPEPWRGQVKANPDTPQTKKTWPRQKSVSRFFGAVGKNQAMANIAYPLRIAWNKRQAIQRFSCHEKVRPSIERVFARTLDHYGHERIKRLRLDLFGGCLAVRRMRGGSSWSMHAWGIAVDMDPERNQLRWGRDRAAFARPEYEKWFEFWYDEGAISLGIERNMDFMHVQFARL